MINKKFHFINRLFAIFVLLALGSAISAQTYYVFYNGTYGYIFNNNGTVGVKTTFDSSCVWRANNDLGNTTSRNIRSYIDNTKYMLGATNAITLGASDNQWRGNGTYLQWRNSSTYYVNHNGSGFVLSSSTANRFYYYEVTINNAQSPTFSISYPTSDAYIGSVNGTMTISANASGNYRPKYYSFNSRHYFEDGTSSTTAPSSVSDYTYTYELVGECANYATISGSTVTYTVDAGYDVVAQVKVTAKPQGSNVIVGQGTCSFVLRSASVSAPVITRIEGTNQYQITSPSQNAQIKYSIDGTDIDEWASNGTSYSGPITVTTDGAVIKAKAVREGNVSEQTSYTVSDVILLPPTISISSAGVVTMTNPNTFASSSVIHFTTDGSDPTSSSPTFSSYTASNMQTIKAIVTATGYATSSVASSQFVIPSGTNGGIVTLNDYEDHNWTYYSDPDSPIKSLFPRNVKITYHGNGLMYTGADGSATTSTESSVAVSMYESDSIFVYYKTLERDANDRFPYELIPNPFSKRPTCSTDGTTKWRGFYGWRIKSISGGSIYRATSGGTAYSVGDILTTEFQQIFFQPTDYTETNANNATSMTVEFEAIWARAYRVTCNANAVNTNIASTTFQTGVSYERNFLVINAGTTGNTSINQTGQRPVTVMMVEPDGSDDYRVTTRYINPTYIITQNNLKFEWMNMQVSSTISANGKNLVLGRGLTANSAAGTNPTSLTTLTAAYVNGLGKNASTTRSTYDSDLNFKLRIESGRYTEIGYLATARGQYGATSSTIHVYGVFGSDYDRAKGENARLTTTGMVSYGYNSNAAILADNTSNYNRETFYFNVKSGEIEAGTIADNYQPGNNGLYLGRSTGNAMVCGNRYMLFEGGIIKSITGGHDITPTNVQTEAANVGVKTLTIRMKGTAEVRTSAFGGAAQNPTYGDRTLIITNGFVHGWVATGCNGIADAQGQNFGKGYMYVGGNAKIGDGSLRDVNGTPRGIVMGAGNGRSTSATTGQMTFGSCVVIADNADVESHVFGGGNYGYTLGTANINIFGGTIHGNVYGGANQKRGQYVDIFMKGGLVEGGIYGGSNLTGDIENDVAIQINGGQVGADASHTANVHGGGLGNATRVLGNVSVAVGKLNPDNTVEGDAVVYGEVYGGSAQGKTNGNTALTTGKTTQVTINSGTINGSVYGGGLGDNTYEADVWGPVTVTINGGHVISSSSALGSVFGCNNVKGRPRSTVTVLMSGGEVDGSVFGGGNAAGYTGNPTVTISGGTVYQHVFGGGLGADIAGDTKVTVKGTAHIKKNVYGGGSEGDVSGNTEVIIGEVPVP